MMSLKRVCRRWRSSKGEIWDRKDSVFILSQGAVGRRILKWRLLEFIH